MIVKKYQKNPKDIPMYKNGCSLLFITYTYHMIFFGLDWQRRAQRAKSVGNCWTVIAAQQSWASLAQKGRELLSETILARLLN